MHTPAIWENPLGTDGFEFVEYASQEPEKLAALFESLGFTAIARHRSKNVTLYRQGHINFILNAEDNGQPKNFTDQHGASANAIAFRVKDAAAAFEKLVAMGAKPVASGTANGVAHSGDRGHRRLTGVSGGSLLGRKRQRHQHLRHRLRTAGRR